MRKLERSLIRNPDFSQSLRLPLFTKGLRFYPKLGNIFGTAKETAKNQIKQVINSLYRQA